MIDQVCPEQYLQNNGKIKIKIKLKNYECCYWDSFKKRQKLKDFKYYCLKKIQENPVLRLNSYHYLIKIREQEKIISFSREMDSFMLGEEYKDVRRISLIINIVKLIYTLMIEEDKVCGENQYRIFELKDMKKENISMIRDNGIGSIYIRKKIIENGQKQGMGFGIIHKSLMLATIVMVKNWFMGYFILKGKQQYKDENNIIFRILNLKVVLDHTKTTLRLECSLI
ncbi:unnamed protein product [Paramecium pentaurelia]|uniref:Uncharacterized protein n=1 Tax=Paramecium pentaurelia TaxID=43138 RepID=A0A8S1SP05_9CILI|nr:unnamed protein product [Paramecium pentaurelia]